MKFNKEFDKAIYAINRDKSVIPKHYWFDYKQLKKMLKNIIKTAQSPRSHTGDECCICLESTAPMMQTFCCHNCIHHKCLVDSLMYSSSNCPLCRTSFKPFFADMEVSLKERADARILSMIIYIYLNILKIENVSKGNLIKDASIRRKYIYLNRTAVTKICKKIHKKLKIDLKDYFLGVLQKRNIMVPFPVKEEYSFLKKMILCFTKFVYKTQ
jgi:hypothetical protein